MTPFTPGFGNDFSPPRLVHTAMVDFLGKRILAQNEFLQNLRDQGVGTKGFL